MRIERYQCLIAATAILACASERTPSQLTEERTVVSIISDSTLVARLLRAPLTIESGKQRLVLSASPWRDFMPIAPRNGSEMMISMRVAPSDSAPLALGVQIDSVWVINQNEVWATRVTEDRGAGGGGTVRGGPKWGPGIPVDVVVLVRVGAKAPRLLRTRNAMVGRTD